MDGLHADGGFVISAAYQFEGDRRPTVMVLPDFKTSYSRDKLDDKKLVMTLGAVLSDADLWVTWYGSGFDVKYVNSRLLKHGLAPMPPKPNVDCCMVSRHNLQVRRNSLANVSQFLGLDSKTHLSWDHWMRAALGEKKSIKYVADHNVQDVVVTRQAYLMMRPLVRQHPSIQAMDDRLKGCPTCGSDKLQARGWRYAQVSKRRQFHCTACGSWPTGKVVKLKAGNG